MAFQKNKATEKQNKTKRKEPERRGSRAGLVQWALWGGAGRNGRVSHLLELSTMNSVTATGHTYHSTISG